MAVTGHVFPQWPLGVMSKLQNLTATDTLKVALSNAAGPVTLATSGVQAAKLLTDWTANVAAEIVGTGYVAGGATVSGQLVTVSGNITTFTISNPAWASAAFTYNQAVLYDSSASTEQLICFWDFGGSTTVASPPLTLQVSGTGILQITPA